MILYCMDTSCQLGAASCMLSLHAGYRRSVRCQATRVWDNWALLHAADQASFPSVETLPCELVAETTSGATMHVEVMPCS